nr:TetM/TetW/TetO/TetS family tetracycline resistance ribosomal protection protein [Paenibacillus bovis]
MYKTVGILAHVDAGKTTFSEQLLYHTNSIKERGRVDHQSTFLDNHEIEKQRGITVFAEQATFEYNNSVYFLIDTPGHVDFSPEMERAVQVMDIAILVISAVEGIQAHTETVWNLLKRHQVPTFIFINKTDRTGANIGKVMGDIEIHLTKDICDITTGMQNGRITEELIECIAERDEDLLDHYMEKGYEEILWLEKMKQMIQTTNIYPCAYGSALQDIGIKEFLDQLDLLTMTNYDPNTTFSGRVYKIRHDEAGTRITFIKAISGKLKVRDEINYSNGEVEKITQIRKYNGTNFVQVDEVQAGEIFAVTGLSSAAIGDGLGTLQENTSYNIVPTLKSKVVFEQGMNMREALKYFYILDAEDPSLHVVWDESLQQIHLHVMGTIQLEVLQQVIQARFGLTVSFDKPEIIYKETIDSIVYGYGHFEPLRHYAEVHLKIEPNERNKGITFESICHTDHLSTSLQNVIKQHVFERDHHGILTGSPLTDVKITLLTGRAHNKHTHGGDFREATFRALRQGLEKAENILLEPYYEFKIKVDLEHMGRVIADIQTASGNFEAPVTEGEKAIITGKAPVATFMDYPTTLATFTKGKGQISLSFDGYERCHNELTVITTIGYDKEADPEYTSSSIFCAKGAGYSVKWDEAEWMMHCEKLEK